MGGTSNALKISSYWGISILGNLRIDIYIYQINNWNIYTHMYIIYIHMYFIYNYIYICILYIYVYIIDIYIYMYM